MKDSIPEFAKVGDAEGMRNLRAMGALGGHFVFVCSEKVVFYGEFFSPEKEAGGQISLETSVNWLQDWR